MLDQCSAALLPQAEVGLPLLCREVRAIESQVGTPRLCLFRELLLLLLHCREARVTKSQVGTPRLCLFRELLPHQGEELLQSEEAVPLLCGAELHREEGLSEAAQRQEEQQQL